MLWNLMLSPLRFCVILYLKHVQFGCGLAKREFAYSDVEAIYLDWPAVKVRCGRRTAAVYLDRQSKAACLTLLRCLCLNAILVSDDHGQLPENPVGVDLDRALRAMERHYRRKAWRGAIGVCYFLALFTFLAWLLFFCWNGNNILKGIAGETLFHIIVGVLAVMLAAIAWKSWRTARTVRDKRKQFSLLEKPLEDQCGDSER